MKLSYLTLHGESLTHGFVCRTICILNVCTKKRGSGIEQRDNSFTPTFRTLRKLQVSHLTPQAQYIEKKTVTSLKLDQLTHLQALPMPNSVPLYEDSVVQDFRPDFAPTEINPYPTLKGRSCDAANFCEC